MTNAQKPNKKLRTKSNHRTTTKGSRGKRSSVFKHGIGKSLVKKDNGKKSRR